MKLVQVTVALLLSLAPLAFARLSHRTIKASRDGQSDISSNFTKRDDTTFFKPGQAWTGKATSYLQSTDGHDGGACGYTVGKGPSMPAFVQGSAQQMGRFAGGNTCGTCLQINPIGVTVKNPSASRIVTILNSCPGSCDGLDIEDEVVTSWFGVRLGQFQMNAKVVPCGYLAKGVHIQYQQISSGQNMYDFRINFRLNSGAIQSAEVSSGSNSWLPLKRANPDQFTLQDYGQSNRVLSQPTFSLRFKNYAGEVITASSLSNTVLKGGANTWQETGVNFSKT